MTDLSKRWTYRPVGAKCPSRAAMHRAQEERRPVQERCPPWDKRVRLSWRQGASGEAQSAATLEEAADRMACELLKMATDDNVADSVKLAAIRDALDRAGLAAKNAVEVELGPPKPYEQIFDRIMVLEGGSREAFRRSQATLEGSARTGALEELPRCIESPINATEGLPETTGGSTKRRTIRRRSNVE